MSYFAFASRSAEMDTPAGNVLKRVLKCIAHVVFHVAQFEIVNFFWRVNCCGELRLLRERPVYFNHCLRDIARVRWGFMASIDVFSSSTWVGQEAVAATSLFGGGDDQSHRHPDIVKPRHPAEREALSQGDVTFGARPIDLQAGLSQFL